MKLFHLAQLPAFVVAHPRPNHDDHIVDLGYAKHSVSWTNVTNHGTTLLNYNNIRYAQPPLEGLRFRKPVVPPPRNEGVSFGNLTASNDVVIPPSSIPPSSFPSSWETDCVSSATIGVPFPLLNGSTWGSEDCLLLNVIVPATARPGDRLPVLHWVIGSAFAFGSKDWTGFDLNTYGLWNKPYDLPDKFIIVTHNYRLGVPGWTPKFEDDMNGNLGVWDSLTAIEWTKKYIDRFGGDPDNITVIGQSAGAAIIAWLLMAENGTLELPFDQAWIASPTIPPRRDLERNRPVWDAILNATGCGDLSCMRLISPEAMIGANKHMLIELLPGAGGGSLGPGVGFSPTVDGELLSDLPASILAEGAINRGIKRLVIGNTAAEVSYAIVSDVANNSRIVGNGTVLSGRHARSLPRDRSCEHTRRH
jgi:carboxylesterase type B